MKKQESFESAIDKLEKIVAEMEKGDLPLENALAKFEEGMKLHDFCSKKLDEVEKKITILLKDKNGDITEAPFDP